MSIGWGYGANMLTKYLGEVGERTPLAAAACIDNPFDLEEATGSFPHHIAMDQKLTGGLIDILRANKELFQGRTKGFNITEGLSATSLRDFDKAISMVSRGFEAVDEFYSKSSTRQLVGNLKIPVLFIQSDDGAVPLISIPRSSIAENPFTSLLLCSFMPARTITKERSAILWCQSLVIEWLAAVELALLKGRHPLLNDMDVTINPSTGLGLVEGRASDRKIYAGNGVPSSFDPNQSYLSYKHENVDRLLNHTQLGALNEFPVDQIRSLLKGSVNQVSNKVSINLETRRDPPGEQSLENAGPQQVENIDAFQKTSSVDPDLVKEGGDDPLDSERSQVTQAAGFVMNMLDVNMPGTLPDEQKRKVLTAVEQGETFMKALEGAVPEDVRGKLTSAVSELVQTQGLNLNPDKLMGLNLVANVTSDPNSKIQEKIKGISSANGGPSNIHFSDNLMKDAGPEKNPSQGETLPESKETMKEDLAYHTSSHELSGETANNHSDSEKPATRLGSEVQPSLKLETPLDLGNTQLEGSCEGEIIASRMRDSNEADQNDKNIEFSQDEATEASAEIVSETGGKSNHQNRTNKASDIEEDSVEKHQVKNNGVAVAVSEESTSSVLSFPEPPLLAKEGNDIQKNEDKNVQAMSQNSTAKDDEESPPPSSSSSLPPITVSQALDALTGFDDSTQMAVNSVFGVIENMIDHLEKENNQSNNGKQNKNGVAESIIASNEALINRKYESKKTENSENGLNIQPDVMQPYNNPVNSSHQKCTESHLDVGNELDQNRLVNNVKSLSMNNIGRSQRNNIDVTQLDMEDKSKGLNLIDSKGFTENSNSVRHVHSFPVHITVNPYGGLPYKEYLRNCFPPKISNKKLLDLDSTTDLFLEYFPEEGQWKLLDQLEDPTDSMHGTEAREGVNGNNQNIHSLLHISDEENVIEPSYVILDTELQHQSTEESEITDSFNKKDEKAELAAARLEEMMFLVKNIILDALKVEVGRRLGTPDMKSMESSLAYELEQVANAVSTSIIKELNLSLGSKGPATMNFGTLQGELIMKAISSSVQGAIHLRKVLPVGVIVGSSLAALRKYFHVTTQNGGDQREATNDEAGNLEDRSYGRESEIEKDYHQLLGKQNQYADLDGSVDIGSREPKTTILNKDTVMVGAFTAALGASALLVHHNGKELYAPSNPTRDKRNPQKEYGKLEEALQERNQSNIVTSLAEKAMSVAGPVVPTKRDGKVDQERMVAILADWGQKGGMLRLVGKIALLWGGIRGAMSLTDRLILFFHIAERPLFQRILGFVCMVLVLWAPVVVPLLPTLVHNWTKQSSTGMAEYACIVGLYPAVMILLVIWGKRIRGYSNPLEQYGLDVTSLPKLKDFLKGLMGGVLLVLSIHSINVLLGFACIVRPSGLPSSPAGAIIWLTVFGRMLLLAARGIVPAAGVSLVEELLFRSWLPEEIAADLGYHRAIIISGLAFSLLQRSLPSVPGLWLLSLTLAGAKQRGQGNLSAPVGLRAGVLTSTFVLQSSTFLKYRPDAPFWATNSQLSQPFGGAVGLAFCITLAILFYPRQTLQKKNISRVIGE
ncbi:uncharacterized protein LOC143863242 isoform X2 [Tasmannia lanceolata]